MYNKKILNFDRIIEYTELFIIHSKVLINHSQTIYLGKPKYVAVYLQ